jgi:hypothetical protein
VISSQRRTSTVLAAVAGLAALVFSPACQRDDSFLLVEVAGDLMLAPVQMRVTVIVGQRSTTLSVPPEPAAISLPTSFTVELDRSITGPVIVYVEAFDAVGTLIALGETTQTHINTGGETIVAVTLGAAP